MSEKKMVRRSVAIALGIICIILIAFEAYFAVAGISAQNSISNLQSQVKDLTDTVNLTKSWVWAENRTINGLPANQSVQVMTQDDVRNAGFILTRTSSTINNTYVAVYYHAHIPVANGTFYAFPSADYDYSKQVSIESHEQDNVFPILPTTVVFVVVGNANTAERANITVSIAYYY